MKTREVPITVHVPLLLEQLFWNVSSPSLPGELEAASGLCSTGEALSSTLLELAYPAVPQCIYSRSFFPVKGVRSTPALLFLCAAG